MILNLEKFASLDSVILKTFWRIIPDTNKQEIQF